MTFRNVSVVSLCYRRSAPALSWDNGPFLWMTDWHCRIVLVALLLTKSGCTRAAFMAANLPTYFDNIAKEDYRFVDVTFAERGFLVVIPDYRKYPPVRLPQFVQDGAKALT